MRPSTAVLGFVMMVACNEATIPPGPAHLEVVTAPPVLAAPGAFLTDTVRVRLVDVDGDPRGGQPITWAVLQGGGTVVPLGSTTNESGIASARWSMGPTSGVNQLEARSLDDSSVVFQTGAEAFRVDQLDADFSWGCGLVQGDLWCWGIGSWVSTEPVSEGPPNGFDDSARGPGLVSQGRGFTALAVGDRSVCVLDLSQNVLCFADPSLPVTAPPQVPAMWHVAGSGSFTFCGLAAADSTAWCWDALSGSGAQVASSPAFLKLEMDLLTLEPTVCGILADSTAACWGKGPLGDGTFNSSTTPVVVSGGHKFREIAVGWDFSCGLEADGDAWCWGRNGELQLNQAGPDSPVPVLAASGINRIEAGRRTVIAFQGGTVVRWGHFGTGFGSLLTPLASVAGLPVADFASNDLSCVRLGDGQVYCYNEMFINSSGIDTDDYSPVKPISDP